MFLVKIQSILKNSYTRQGCLSCLVTPVSVSIVACSSSSISKLVSITSPGSTTPASGGLQDQSRSSDPSSSLEWSSFLSGSAWQGSVITFITLLMSSWELLLASHLPSSLSLSLVTYSSRNLHSGEQLWNATDNLTQWIPMCLWDHSNKIIKVDSLKALHKCFYCFYSMDWFQHKQKHETLSNTFIFLPPNLSI